MIHPRVIARCLRLRWLVVCLPVLFAMAGRAQEKPYFVAYSHDLEEPGNLEIETKTALARPDGGTAMAQRRWSWRYGVRARWTTELYLDGQATVAGFYAVYRLPLGESRPAADARIRRQPRAIRGVREHLRRGQDDPRSGGPRQPGRSGGAQRRPAANISTRRS